VHAYPVSFGSIGLSAQFIQSHEKRPGWFLMRNKLQTVMQVLHKAVDRIGMTGFSCTSGS